MAIRKFTSEELVTGVLKRDRRAIAKMMSLAETGSEESRTPMAEIFRHAGKAHVIGITGVPGSGKSTLVRALALEFRKQGSTVGIVAIDPSSPFSGGAILGDRIRMSDLSGDDGIFIRSMATRGALGGLARASLDTVDVLDAAGFDIVIIETVGVGQDEVDIAEAAQTVAVVSAPGLGDDIQAIKAGVLEIADIHIISKSDKPDAGRTLADLQAMQGLGTSGRDRFGWQVPVVATSGETGQGIAELAKILDEHHAHLLASGEIAKRHHDNLEMRILKTASDLLLKQIEAQRDRHLDELLAVVAKRDLDPGEAARSLIEKIALKNS